MISPILSPGWEPAAARMLSIPAPQRLRGLGPTPSPQLTLQPKSSADNLDYGLCPQQWLAGTTDYVAHVAASVLTATGDQADLTISWVSLVSGTPVLFLGGGQPGTVQTLQVSLTTQQGRVWSAPVSLAITNTLSASGPLAVPTLSDGTPIPPNAMQLPGGGILTLGSTTTLTFEALLLPDGSPMLDTDSGALGQSIASSTSDLLLIA